MIGGPSRLRQRFGLPDVELISQFGFVPALAQHPAPRPSGVGRICIGRDSQPQALYPGETVMIPPNTMHWHGAATDKLFAHLAMSEVGDQGQGTDWGAHVRNTDYRKEAAS